VSWPVFRFSQSVWWANRVALFLLLAVLLFGTGWFVLYAIAAARFPFELGYTEGTILCLMREWVGGGSLYGPLDRAPYYVNIYPPGFYVINLGLARVFGDPVQTGRLLASGSALAVGALILVLVARSRATMSRRILLLSGLVAATLFLSSPTIMREASILRVDMPAIFLGLLGLLIYTETAGRSAMQYLSVIPFVLSLFVKQSMLAAPLACLIGGILCCPAAAFRLFIVICISVAALLFVSYQVLGHALLFQVFLANDIGFGMERSLHGLRLFAGYYIPLIGTGVVSILLVIAGSVQARRKPELREAVLLSYLLLVLVEMTIALSRPGTGENWFFQPTVALCLFAGIGLCKILPAGINVSSEERSMTRATVSMGVIFLLLIQGYVYAGGLPRLDLEYLSGDQRRVVEHLKRLNSPVITRYSFLACIAGKTAYANQYMVTQMADAGRWDQTRYVDAVNRKTAVALVMRYDLDTTDRWEIQFLRRCYTPEMLDAFRENYDLRARYGAYRIYEPKRGGE